MTNQNQNYSVKEVGPLAQLAAKTFIGQDLGLTGCEVSMNHMEAGKAAPFVHAHKLNEELYIITGGNGVFFVDGVEFPVREGSLVRVAPAGERAYIAGEKGLTFICIQAQAGSLTQANREDGIKLETKLSWLG